MQERVVKRAEVGEGLWWHCGSTVEGSGVGEESEEWRCGGAACTSASSVEGSLFQKQRWDWGVCAVREGERVVVATRSGKWCDPTRLAWSRSAQCSCRAGGEALGVAGSEGRTEGEGEGSAHRGCRAAVSVEDGEEAVRRREAATGALELAHRPVLHRAARAGRAAAGERGVRRAACVQVAGRGGQGRAGEGRGQLFWRGRGVGRERALSRALRLVHAVPQAQLAHERAADGVARDGRAKADAGEPSRRHDAGHVLGRRLLGARGRVTRRELHPLQRGLVGLVQRARVELRLAAQPLCVRVERRASHGRRADGDGPVLGRDVHNRGPGQPLIVRRSDVHLAAARQAHLTPELPQQPTRLLVERLCDRKKHRAASPFYLT